MSKRWHQDPKMMASKAVLGGDPPGFETFVTENKGDLK